jgi:hypothetical protein
LFYVQDEDVHFGSFKSQLFTGTLAAFARTQIEFEKAKQNKLRGITNS